MGEIVKNEKKLSPKAKARYDKFIDATAEVFYESGFEDASMNDIVKKAGGSMTTLYKVFGSKETLFREMLDSKTSEMFARLRQTSVDYNDNIEGFLFNLGSTFIELITDDRAVALHRMIVTQGHKNNSLLGKIFLEYTMEPMANIIAAYLKKEKEKKNIDVEDTDLAAYQFLHALKDPYLFKKVLGLNIEITKEDKEKALRQAVNTICNGIKTRKV